MVQVNAIAKYLGPPNLRGGRKIEMSKNTLSKITLTAMVALLFVLLAGVSSAQLAYDSVDDLESDPFAGNWSRANAEGNADWSTAQAHSGSNSIYLTRTAGGFGEDPRVWIPFSGVPQTGKVQVSWWLYPTGAHGGNFTVFGHFGTTTTQAGGDQAILEVAYASGPQEIYISDGNGWNDGPGEFLSAHANQWTSHRVVFDQDARTYDYYFDDGSGGGEVQIRDDFNLSMGSAKLGDGTYNYFLTEPFTQLTEWYIDDLYIGPETSPAPTPEPVNNVENWLFY